MTINTTEDEMSAVPQQVTLVPLIQSYVTQMLLACFTIWCCGCGCICGLFAFIYAGHFVSIYNHCYCCDRRSYCMQYLTLFIVTATSRPLNKKIRLLSVRGSNNYCGSASAIRSPHTSVCACSRRSHRVTVQRHRVIVDKGAVLSTPSLNPIDTYGVSSACQFVFCGAFCG